jgi:GNAT superfamily N-acetyltransferase
MSHGVGDITLTVRRYDDSAAPVVLDLAKQVLGERPATRKTPEYWHWKHHQNPFGASYGLYAWDEAAGRVAALRILLRWRFQTPGGGNVLAVRAVDTATHPEYRRQGLFSMLTRRAIAELGREGVQLIFNTPNRDTSLPGYLKMGWQVVANWSVQIRPMKPARMLFHILRRRTQARALPPFGSYFRDGIVTWAAFEAKWRSVLPTFVSTAEEARPAKGFRTPRDLPYLHWRYGQHPHLRYGVYAVEDAKGLAGFAVLRPNLRFGLKELVLTDLVLRAPEMALGRRMLRQLVAELRGDHIVALFAPGTPEREMVRQAGFFGVPRQGILFTALAMDRGLRDPLDAANWDLTLGDLDLF